MADKTKDAVGRREFLRTFGAGASVVAVAAAATTVAGPVVARESRQEARKARYQANSAHVQAFYRTNRY